MTGSRRAAGLIAAGLIAAGLVVLAGSVAWLVVAFGALRPCGLAAELSSVCVEPPAAVRTGQLALAVPGAAAGVLAGVLAVVAARRPGAVRWQRPGLAVLAVAVLAWIVVYDVGVLALRS